MREREGVTFSSSRHTFLSVKLINVHNFINFFWFNILSSLVKLFHHPYLTAGLWLFKL